MSNHLKHAQSPYLLQHRENPVDWYPWGAAAFEKARDEDKPIFLSIGYSTCHWCHVMAHESFEDEQVARLMNDTFVSIKVDREERPDVDGVYMTVCQMMTGQGGWPLTIVMTPEKKPFFAATYIPKHGRYGRPGMLELVPRIGHVWSEEREKATDSADRIADALKRSAAAASLAPPPPEEALHAGFAELRERYDAVHGGFGGAPKFPSPHNLMFLLRYGRSTGEDRAVAMVSRTLEAMRLGGVYDHVGYGFHRYATDAEWLLPHFEKMLHDQALLAMAYTEGYQVTGRDLFARTAHEILAYVLREMTSPDGAFFSAEDADSEGREGKFYVWSVDEVREVLGSDLAPIVIDLYNLAVEGNFAEEATRRRTGENVLHLDAPLDALARERGLDEPYLEKRLDEARRRLFEHRAQRVRPGRDDKVLTDWNGLMVAAFAKAAQVFGDDRCARVGRRAADFILDHLRDDEGRLLHRYRDGRAGIRAHLDDYAYLTWGLIELYEATYDVDLLEAALALTAELRSHYWDDATGGFFFTADDAEALILRQKPLHDGALPSGNAVAMLNLLRLGRMTGDPSLEEAAEGIRRFAAAEVARMPSGFCALLMGLSFVSGPAREVVVAGPHGRDDTRRLLTAIQTTFLPHTVSLLRTEETAAALGRVAPFTEAQRPLNERATAYVCRNFQCAAPTTDVDDMLEQLGARTDAAP